MRLIPALGGVCDTQPMNKCHSLAAIINAAPEEDLAGLAVDDLLLLLHGPARQTLDPAVTAARKKVATAILRHYALPDVVDTPTGRCLH